ncbi:MAG: glutamate-5-semialdehyde dehydrogenase [Candidatus Lambdaproteobacteria bacterium]|nr:glutamate-5-semialdehyde dehydrogenase [Candidatus Lambdaproteobacteria bacterium]
MEQAATHPGGTATGAPAQVRAQAQAAAQAARHMALCSSEEKDDALRRIAAALHDQREAILTANAQDMAAGERAGLGTRLDRILLTAQRIEAICADIHTVVALPDPVGQEIDARVRPNGLRVQRIRAPLGVVGIIYEARPNVTVDAAVLCLKSGNAVVLKGGSDALHSNRAVVAAIHQGLQGSALPPAAVQLLGTSRDVTAAFLRQRGLIDVIIPRGGQALIRYAQEHALVPVIETGASVVHAYVDRDVDVAQAAPMILNAKTRRVSICNALDTLLVHRAALAPLCAALGPLLARTQPAVEVRADVAAHAVLAPLLPAERLRPLDPQRDYGVEFLDYILAVGTVPSFEAAVQHIDRYSLKHTEAIYTRDRALARRFQRAVDAACVIHNASTQFVDGGEFGLGAEIGISTQKLHVRGPFALEGLTTMKWIVDGDGQLRP